MGIKKRPFRRSMPPVAVCKLWLSICLLSLRPQLFRPRHIGSLKHLRLSSFELTMAVILVCSGQVTEQMQQTRRDTVTKPWAEPLSMGLVSCCVRHHEQQAKRISADTEVLKATYNRLRVLRKYQEISLTLSVLDCFQTCSSSRLSFRNPTLREFGIVSAWQPNEMYNNVEWDNVSQKLCLITASPRRSIWLLSQHRVRNVTVTRNGADALYTQAKHKTPSEELSSELKVWRLDVKICTSKDNAGAHVKVKWSQHESFTRLWASQRPRLSKNCLKSKPALWARPCWAHSNRFEAFKNE